MRPEMTESSIREVLNWSSLNKLIVIVDGLRAGAAETEKSWRDQTIRIAEKYCNENKKVDLWVYDSNPGITQHTMRIQGRALESGFSGMWLEEDFRLDLESYSSIASEVFEKDTGRPLLLSAYSHFNHPRESTQKIKSNLFLPLWGMTFNETFYNLINRVWNDKKFDADVVSKAIDSVFPDSKYGERIYKEKVTNFWTQYSSWGFKNSNRWDAVANYALWTQSEFSHTTVQRYAHDLSFKDSRGMNPRIEPEPVTNHKLSNVSFEGNNFCLDCENWGSRIERRLSRRLAASVKYRLNSRH